MYAPVVLLLISGSAVRAQDNLPPKVVRVTGTIQADDLIEVYVEHLRGWVAAGNDPNKLIPYINGMALAGNYSDGIHLDRDRTSDLASLHFHLRITPENKERWVDLLGASTGIRRPVSFSVGLLEKHSPFDTVFDDGNSLPLVVVDPPYGAIALLVVAGMLIAFIRLARNTNLIRETAVGMDDGALRPYNLGRTQMAFWFLLVCASYIVIWLVTGALDTITASLLALMGISAGTALGEAMIDADKVDAKAEKIIALNAQKQAIEQGLAEAPAIPGAGDALQLEDARTRQLQIGQQLRGLTQTGTGSGTAARSRGFIRDILSGGADYSLHRFQIVVWTIVLGIMFLSSVYNNLTMPEFSATLLGLMGLSSGTYIGFKFPEKK